MYPTRVPAAIPSIEPRHVFPLPSIGFLSANFMLRSSGVFPPRTTGDMFAKYAGNISQSDCIISNSMSIRIIPVFVFLFYLSYFLTIIILEFVVLCLILILCYVDCINALIS